MSLGIYLPGETPTEEFTDAVELATELAYLGEFRSYLKDIDPQLDLIRVKNGAASFPEDAWGKFVMIRRNPLGERTIAGMWIVQNEDGSYCLPDERHLTALRARDMAARPTVWHDHQKALAREKEQKRRRKESAREDFRSAFRDRLDHHLDRRISVSVDLKALAARELAKGAPGGHPA